MSWWKGLLDSVTQRFGQMVGVHLVTMVRAHCAREAAAEQLEMLRLADELERSGQKELAETLRGEARSWSMADPTGVLDEGLRKLRRPAEEAPVAAVLPDDSAAERGPPALGLASARRVGRPPKKLAGPETNGLENAGVY